MERTFFQKKARSFIKRALLNFVNKSDSYIIQHLPEATHASFPSLRQIWTVRNENNRADFVRLLFLTCTVEELLDKNVPGAFAELGVYKGNSAKLLRELAPERKLYLFDTFSGFDAKDIASDPKTKISSLQFLDTSIEMVKQFVGSENVLFCPGHFPKTASFVPEEEIFALVHLDADLYQPTLAGLEFFYPKLAFGGCMIIHDYFSGAWPGVKKAVDAFLLDKPESLVRIPDKSGTAIFQKCRLRS